MILASFTMGTHSLFLGFFLLYLTAGVRGQEDVKTHLIISNQIYTSQNNMGLTCQDDCDETGEIIDCMLKASGKCLSRYYLVCLKNQFAECQTINSSCPDESGLLENKCEEALLAKNVFGENTRKQSRRFMRSNTSGMKKLNNLYRRDLGASDDVVPLFSPKSAMVASSGNGHAYVVDGDRIAESHFGGPPVVSSLSSGGKTDGMMNFPFPWVSPMLEKFRSDPEPTIQQTSPKEQDLYGQSQYPPYRPQGMYNPMYGSDYGMHKYPPYYGNGYGSSTGTYPRPKPYSPFSAFFNSVGLQDPMLMLQYLPIAFMTPVGKEPYQSQDSLDHSSGETRMPDWVYLLP